MKTSEIMGEMYLEIKELRSFNEKYRNNIRSQQNLINELQDRIEDLEFKCMRNNPTICDTEEKLNEYEQWVESQEKGATNYVDDIKHECIGRTVSISEE